MTINTTRLDKRQDSPVPIEVHLRYPHVSGLGSAAAALAVNRSLADMARTTAAQLVQQASDPSKRTGIPGEAWTVNGFYEIASKGPPTLAVRVFADINAVGAHGSRQLTTSNFDWTTGRRYELRDLFKPDSYYLTILSGETRSALVQPAICRQCAEAINEQNLADGTSPDASNFAGFIVGRDGLEITFAEYQVGPYSAGMPRIAIPYAKLRRFASPVGPLARS